MTILELPQGYYTDLSGVTLHQALAIFAIDKVNFERKYPHLAPTQPIWHQFEVDTPNATAPIGYEWYRIDDDTLHRHSAHYDSTG